MTGHGRTAENDSYQLRRSCLYIGGGSPAKILEARFCDADCVVYDLEDSVAAADKDAARMLIYRAVRYHRPPGSMF